MYSLQRAGGEYSVVGVNKRACQNFRNGFELPLGVKLVRVRDVGQQWSGNAGGPPDRSGRRLLS